MHSLSGPERKAAIRPSVPVQRRLSRRLFCAARDLEGGSATMTIGELVATLGDKSFGWSIVLFALVNLLPMPVGSNMVTSIPLILLTFQMACGLRQVRLPLFVTRYRINRRGFQRMILRLGPVFRPIERVVRPRYRAVLAPRLERGLGVFLVFVAIALFVPIPLVCYLPATALLVTGVGIVERDGYVVLGGAALGLVAILVTGVVGGIIVMGAASLLQ